MARALVDAMSPEDLAVVFGIVGGDKAFRVSVPDPDIGYLGKSRIEFNFWNEPVQINNAGFRSKTDFARKRADVFRIVVLGDSYVFGDGVAEEDRFSDQIQAYIDVNGIRHTGQKIEVVSVGLGGWNMVQETAYLSARLSDYDPDIILMLVLENDFAPNLCFSHGTNSNRYSPEERAMGSGFLCDFINLQFKDHGARGAIAWLDTPSALAYWDKAIGGLKRLEDLQHRRGKKLLITAMNPVNSSPGPFVVRLQDKLRNAGITSPYLPVTFLRTPERLVVGDSHPNAAGHRILRDQYIRAMHDLGWLALEDDQLPEANPEITFSINADLRRAHYEWYVSNYVEEAVLDEFDFCNLKPLHSRAFLAGISPAKSQLLGGFPPWAARRAIFAMKAPAIPGKTLEVRIHIPRKHELFPLTIDLVVDAEKRRRFDFADMSASGEQLMTVELGEPSECPAIEVALYTSQHFSRIEDNRMLCFRLLSARYI